MNTFNVFGHIFNGLEFVTYILIPSAMVLMILIYIYFNYWAIKATFNFDVFDFDDE